MTYRADHFTALLDACVLAGVLKRNLLLSLAEAELFRPRWSAPILDEMERAIDRMTNGQADTARQRQQMITAFGEACVTGFEVYIPSVDLPDANDRHVVAAAICTHAQVVVTDNLKDFPAAVLATYGMEVKSTDDFIADTITLHEQTAFAALKKMRERFANPALSTEAIINAAESQGLLNTALLMKRHEGYW